MGSGFPQPGPLPCGQNPSAGVCEASQHLASYGDRSRAERLFGRSLGDSCGNSPTVQIGGYSRARADQRCYGL
jgi:hypothetical protein